jgi:Fe(3+) dicitrate transport protein
MRSSTLLLLLSTLSPLVAKAQMPTQPPVRRSGGADTTRADTTQALPGMRIIGRTARPLDRQPGAVTVIPPAELRRALPLTVNEMVRRSPGVHAVDEDGLGFRTNIAVRGVDPGRSGNMVLLEDGVPAVHAPYTEPQTYFSPPVERMSSLEISKGASSVLYGPQTTGGVINYLTAPAFSAPTASLRLLGSGNILNAYADVGGPVLGAATRLSWTRKQVADLRDVWAQVDDWTLKVTRSIGDRQRLSVKAQYYQERTNQTYLGLTQSMLEDGQLGALAPDDRFRVRRPTLALFHDAALSPRWTLRTNAFTYLTARDNRRQDFTRNTTSNARPSGFTGVIWGDTTVRGGAVFMRRTSGSRNRTISVAGIESRLTGSFTAGGAEHELQVGARGMREWYNSKFQVGRTPTSSDSLTRDREARLTNAGAAWVSDRMSWGRFSLTPGLRLENPHFTREVRRAQFGSRVADTLIANSRSEAVLLPALGATWLLPNGTDAQPASLFANVHRGYAPFRVAEAIDNSGNVTPLEPERSWNYEAGVRTSLGAALQVELTGFLLLFQNQTVSASDLWGRTDELATGMTNGGRTRNAGVESALRLSLDQTMLALPVSVGARYTYTDARFTSDRLYQSGVAGVPAINVNGRHLPYAPRHLFNADVSARVRGLEAQLFVNRVGQQFGDRRNLATPSPDGQVGVIDGYTLVDFNLAQNIPLPRTSQAQLLFSVKNLFDETAVVSRRPQGIRLALPRQLLLGVRL